MLGDVFGQVEIYDAGFDDGDAVFYVNVEDAGHARERENEAAVFGDGAAAESGAGSARDDGDLVTGRDPDAAGDFLGAVGERDDGGQGAVNGAVVLEDDEVFGLVQDVLVADDGLKLLYYGSEVHGFALPSEANDSLLARG